MEFDFTMLMDIVQTIGLALMAALKVFAKRSTK